MFKYFTSAKLNCVGRNESKYLVALYIRCAQSLKISSINRKYLVVRHTQNEDHLYSLIRRPT